MNHTYRVVFNESTGTYVAVAEIMPAKGKKSKSSKTAIAAAVAALAGMAGEAGAVAVTTGGQAGVAIGTGTTANNGGAQANVQTQVAIGRFANANSAGKTIAIGGVNDNENPTSASAGFAIAIGSGANATGGGDVVLGTEAAAYQRQDWQNVNGVTSFETQVRGDTSRGNTPSTVIGFKATGAGNQGDTIVGAFSNNNRISNTQTNGRVSQTTILGSRSVVGSDQATAIGADVRTVGNSSIAMGGDDVALARTKLNAAGIATFDGVDLTTLGLPQERINILTQSANGDMVIYDYNQTNANMQGVNIPTSAIGDASLAIMPLALSVGTASSAIGVNAITKGELSQAIGTASRANSLRSNAFGARAVANNTDAIAVGSFSNADGFTSNAIGANSTTTAAANHSIAIGTNANASTFGAIMVGANTRQLRPVGGIASATELINSNTPVVVMGYNATSQSRFGDTIIGSWAKSENAQVAINQATAIGSRAVVYGDQGVAVGADTRALGNSSVAIGGDDLDKAAQALAPLVGVTWDGNISAVSSKYESFKDDVGTDLTDYINTVGNNRRVYPNTAAIGDVSLAIGTGSQTLGVASNAIGANALAKGLSSTAMGTLSRAWGESSIAIGTNANASGLNATAIGHGAIASGTDSISVGTGNRVTGNSSGAFGDPSVVSGEGSYSVGNNNTITTNDTFVLGSGVNRGQTDVGNVSNNLKGTVGNSVYLGKDSEATAGTAINTAALKSDQTAGTTTTAGDKGTVDTATVNGIKYDGFAGATANGVVTIGASGSERRLQNVAAGEISKTSTDAINGSQLYLTQVALGNLANSTATHLGGGSTVNENGTLTAPVYNITNGKADGANNVGNAPVNNSPFNNVGDALTALNTYVNQGFNVQENGTTKGTVTPNENISFVGENGTTVKVDTEAGGTTVVRISSAPATGGSVSNTNLTVNPNGQIATPDAANGGSYVNATSLAEAINKTGWNVTSGVTGTGVQDGTATVEQINPGDEVKFQAGNGLTIKQEGSTFTYSANTGTATVGNDGKAATTSEAGSLATVGDVVNVANNVSWALQANGEKKDDVKAGDVVNFANGTGTTVSIENTAEGSTIKVNVDSTPVTFDDTNGTATATNPDAPAKAGDVANVTNATVTHLTNKGMNFVGNDGTTAFHKDLGETVNVTGGMASAVGASDRNTFVDVVDNKLVVKISETPIFNNVTLGNGTNTVSLNPTENGLKLGDETGAPVQISNVAPGTNGTDAVNLDQLNGTKWNLNTFANGGNAEGSRNVTVGNSTVNLIAGKGIKTIQDGTNVTFEADVQTTVANTNLTVNPNGQIATPDAANGGSYVNATSLAEAINKTGWNVTSGVEGSGKQDGTASVEQINPGAEVAFKAGNGLTIKQDGKNFTYSVTTGTATVGNDGKAVSTDAPETIATVGDLVNVANNVSFGLAENGAKKDDVKAGDVVNFANGTGTTVSIENTAEGSTIKVNVDSTPVTFDDTNGTATATNPDAPAKAGDVANVTNATVTHLTNKGMNFVGNDGTTAFHKNLGETVNVTGGMASAAGASDRNTFVDVVDNKLVVKISETPIFNNVTLGNGTNTVSLNPTENGLKLGDETGAPVQISNVAPGTNGTDAVNLDQLNGTKWNLNTFANGGNAEGSRNVTVGNSTVNLIAGKGIKTIQDGTNVTFEADVQTTVANTNLTVNPNGQIATPDAANGGSYVNATSLAEAINKTGWNVTSGVEGSGKQDGTASVEQINPGAEVAFKAGNGLTIKQDGKNFTYSVTTGTATVGNDGKAVSTDAPETIATVGDLVNVANNVSFGLAENGAKKDDVKAGDVVNFANGTGTTVSIENTAEGSTIKVNVDSTPVTFDDTNGTATATNPDAPAKAGDVANVTNATVTHLTNKGMNFVGNDGTTAFHKDLGETVNVTGGMASAVGASDRNTFVDVVDNKLVVKISETPIFNNVTLGNGTNTVSLNPTENGLKLGDETGAPVQISNVAPGTNGTDAVNLDQLNGTKWNLNTFANGGNAEGSQNVTVGNSTVNLIAGKGIKTIQDGTNVTFEADVQTTVAHTNLTVNPNGQIATPDAANGGSYVNATSLAEAINKTGWNVTSDVVNGGVREGAAATTEQINPGDEVKFQAGKGLTIEQAGSTFTYSVNTGTATVTDGKAVSTDAPETIATVGDLVNVANNVSFGLAENGAKKDDVKAGDVVNFANGTGTTVSIENTAEGSTIKVNVDSTPVTFDDTNGTATATNPDAPAKAGDVANVTNATVTHLTNKGMNFVGNDGTTAFHKNLGETVNVTGGMASAAGASDRNTFVDVVDNKLVVKISETPIFNNVTLGNGTNTVSLNPTENGLKLGDETGAPVQISNVAPGTNGTDAVNLDQLNGTKWNLNTFANGGNAEGSRNVTVGNSTVNLIAGKGIKTIQDGTNVTFEADVQTTVANTNLTVNPNGQIATPDAANGGSYVNATSLAEAINKTGWNVTSDVVNGGVREGAAATTEQINPGDEVKFQAGKGLTIEQAGSTFTYSVNTGTATVTDGKAVSTDAPETIATVGDLVNVANNVSFGLAENGAKKDDVKAGDVVNFANGTGTTVSIENTAEGSTIKVNVDSTPVTFDDTNGTATATNPDAPAKAGDVANVTNATVTHLTNKGMNFVGNDGTTAFHKNLGETVNVTGGMASAAGASDRNTFVDVVDNKLVVKISETPIFNNVTLGNGTNTVSLNPTENGLKLGDETGAPVQISNVAPGTNGTDAVNLDQLNGTKWNLNTFANGGNAEGSRNVTVGNSTVNLIAGKGIKTIQDGTNVTFEADVQTTVANTNLTVNPNGQIATPDAANGGSYVNATSLAEAINKTGWNVTSDVVNGGVREGAAATTEQINPGDEVKFQAGKGLTIEQAGSTFTYSVNTGTATVTDGKAVSTDAPETIATVGDLVNVANNVSFGLAENGAKKDDVKAGDVIDFVNGQGTNVNITTENGVSTIKFDTPVTYVDGTGAPTNTPSNTVSFVGGDKDAPVTVTNVDSGLKQYNNTTPATAGTPKADLVDLNTPNVDNNTAATVGDLRNMGWIVSADKTTGSLNDAYSESVKNAEEVKFVGVNGATVSGKTEDGVRTITVDVNAQGVTNAAQLPVVYTNKAGDKVYLQPNGDFTTNADGTGTVVPKADVIASMNSGDNSTTAPTTLANVGSNLEDASNGVADKTPDANSVANLADAKNNAATVGDVLNAGWNLQENGTAKDTVTHADTVNFVNGQGTNVNITTENGVSTIKFDTPVTYVDGTGAPTNTPSNTVSFVGGDKDAPVTVTNVDSGLKQYNNTTPATAGTPKADLVDLNTPNVDNNTAATVGDLRNMGWIVSADKTTGSLNDAYSESVKNAEEVKFVGVNGATVSGKTEDGVRTITVDVNAQGVTNAAQLPVVYTNKAGDKVYLQPNGDFTTNADGTGTVVPKADVIASMNSGDNSTTAPTTLANVGSNLEDASNGVADKTPDANSVANLADAKNNAATVGDVLNAGWNLQENGTAKDTVTHADTVNFVNGQGTNVNITTENGVSTIKFDTPVTYVDGTGAPTNTPSNTVSFVGGDKDAPVTVTNVDSGLKQYNNTTPATAGTPKADLVDLNTPNVDNNTAATVGDLRNMGWIVSADKTTGSLNDAYSESVKNAEEVKFVGVNGATVSGKTEDGVRTITVDVNAQGVTNAAQLPVVYTNKAGDKVYLQPNGDFTTNADGTGTVVPKADVIASMNSGDNSTTAPTTLANVKGNLEDASNGVADKTPDANSVANLADAKNNAATVGDVLNAGWNLQENGTAKDTVTHADTVNFVNGQGTNVNITTENGVSTIKFDTPVTYVDGTGAPTNTPSNTVSFVGGDKDAPVTVTNVDSGLKQYNNTTPATAGTPKADLVDLNTPNVDNNTAATVGDLRNMGWIVSADKTTGSLNDAYSESVKNAEEVKFVGVNGATVSGKTEDGVRTITVDVNAQGVTNAAQLPVVYTNKAGDKVYLQPNGDFTTNADGTGTVVPKADVIASMNSGDNSTTAPTTLANVKGNLEDASNGVADKTPDANSVANLADAKNNAATVGDVLNAGWNLQENGTAKDTVTHADTVNFVNGQGTNVNITTENGVSTIKFDTPVTYVDGTGAPTNTPSNTVSFVGGDKDAPVTVTNVDSGLKQYNNTTPATAGTPKADLVDLNTPNVDNNTAATVGDLRNMGWIVSADKTTGSLNDAYSESVKNAEEVKFVGVNGATVSGKTEDGVRTITVDVNAQGVTNAAQLPVVYTNKAGDKVYLQPNGDFTTNADGTGTVVPKADVIASMNSGDNSTTAPTTLANVKGNLEDASNGVADKTPDANSVANLADAKNNAATVGDVLNAGWNLQENGTAKDTVTHADTVNFVNGQGTNVNITTENGVSTIKFDTPVTYVDGTGAPTNTPSNTVSFVGGDKDAPVTVTNVDSGLKQYNNTTPATAGTPKADLVDLNTPNVDNNTAATVGDLRNMGWIVSADKTTGSLNDAYSESVKNAEEVKFVGVNGATVSGKTEDGVRTITVDVNAQGVTNAAQLPVVYTNKAGDKVYLQPNGDFTTNADGTGTVVPKADVIASMNSGDNSTTAPTTLANVKGNLEDASNGVADKTPDANSVANLADAKNNAATVGDVLNAGWNLQENGTAKDTVTHADTVNFVNGQGTNVNITTENGVSTIKFDTPVTYVDGTGAPTNTPSNTVSFVGGDKDAPVTVTNVDSGLKQYNNTTPATAGTPKADLVDLNTPNVDNNTAATVGDLRNMGWIVSADKTTGSLNDAYSESVKNAEEVKFVGVNGATVSGKTEDGVRTITVDVNAQGVTNAAQLPVVYTNKAGDKVYLQPNGDFTTNADGTGTVVPKADVIASMNSGDNSTTAPTTLANVKGNLEDASNGVADKTPDANSVANLDAAKNNAATVGDVLNAGWNLQENGTAKDTVTHADTVNFVNGQGTNVNITTENGVSTIKFDTPVTYVDGTGAPTNTPSNTVSFVGGDKDAPVTVTNVDSGLTPSTIPTMPAGNTGSPVNSQLINFNNPVNANILPTTVATVGDLRNLGWVVSAAGNNYSDAVKSADQVEFVGEGGVNVTGVTKDGKRIITITGGGNGGSVVAGDNVNVNTTTVTGPNGTTASTYKVSAPSVNINANSTTGTAQFTNPANTTGLVTAADVVDTINNVSWNSTTDKVDTGVASTTGNTSVKAGDTITYIAGSNIKLAQDGKNLTIATNDNVTFNTMNATNVNVAPAGNLTVGGNATVDMGGNRILNVAPGELSATSTDAVNGSQLYSIAGDLNNKIEENAARTVTVNKVDPSVLANATSANGQPISGNEIEFADGVGTSVNVMSGNVNGKNVPIISVDTTNTYVDTNGVATTKPTNVVQMIGGAKNEDGSSQPVSVTNVASGVSTINADGTVTEVPVGNVRAAAILNADPSKHHNAVNVGDLHSVGNALNQKIDQVVDDADAGTAAAMATAGLPQVYLPGKSMIAVAGSTYRGKQGYAVGFSAITDGGNWIVKGSVSGHSKGKFGATVGAGYQW